MVHWHDDDLMRESGVRELNGSLSAILRAVSRGEQMRVTLRGEPVADIVPAGTRAGDGRAHDAATLERAAEPPGRDGVVGGEDDRAVFAGVG